VAGDRMRPLDDVRVISLEQYGAGPFATLHLADLGAEVIKIEVASTGGDVGRHVPPFAEGGTSLFFETFNRNKKSLALDLRNESGRLVFERLVAVSDVVFSNLRGDVPEKLKIRYADLAEINPRVVCCSLSAFGMTGPRKGEPGYDHILQGIAGWMSLTGEPDAPPTRTGLSLVDYAGGLVATASILCGLHAAGRDGVGGDCDVSLFDTAISLLTYPATWFLTGGYLTERRSHSAHPSLVPFQHFETEDGWIVVACAKQEFWVRLTDALGRPDLCSDDRFATFEARREHAPQLLDLLGLIFHGRPTAYWIAVLRDAGVPAGPVNTLPEALADPQTAARHLVVEAPHPVWGTVRQLASPIRFGDSGASHRPAPRLNEHGTELLANLLACDEDEIGALAAAGAFGLSPQAVGEPGPERGRRGHGDPP